MDTFPNKGGLYLGDFIVAACETFGEHKAGDVVQFALDTRLVCFHDIKSIRLLINRLDTPIQPHETKKGNRS